MTQLYTIGTLITVVRTRRAEHAYSTGRAVVMFYGHSVPTSSSYLSYQRRLIGPTILGLHRKNGPHLLASGLGTSLLFTLFPHGSHL